jgi:two-component system C4-dicarboxylate transport response regulator DctD
VLAADTLVRLCAHDWPGNVRELENALESFTFTGRLVLEATHAAPAAIGPGPATDLLHLSYHDAKTQAVRRFQQQFVAAVLAAHGGNVAAAAEQMGLSRFGLEKVLRQLEEASSPIAR